MARILSSFSVGSASLRRLTELFEWAKFSQHAVDASMKEEAIDALQRVRADLSNAPVRVVG
jgi:ribulose bisphosphate carboxylase small subunit